MQSFAHIFAESLYHMCHNCRHALDLLSKAMPNGSYPSVSAMDLDARLHVRLGDVLQRLSQAPEQHFTPRLQDSAVTHFTEAAELYRALAEAHKRVLCTPLGGKSNLPSANIGPLYGAIRALKNVAEIVREKNPNAAATTLRYAL